MYISKFLFRSLILSWAIIALTLWGMRFDEVLGRDWFPHPILKNEVVWEDLPYLYDLGSMDTDDPYDHVMGYSYKDGRPSHMVVRELAKELQGMESGSEEYIEGRSEVYVGESASSFTSMLHEVMAAGEGRMDIKNTKGETISAVGVGTVIYEHQRSPIYLLQLDELMTDADWKAWSSAGESGDKSLIFLAERMKMDLQDLVKLKHWKRLHLQMGVRQGTDYAVLKDLGPSTEVLSLHYARDLYATDEWLPEDQRVSKDEIKARMQADRRLDTLKVGVSGHVKALSVVDEGHPRKLVIEQHGQLRLNHLKLKGLRVADIRETLPKGRVHADRIVLNEVTIDPKVFQQFALMAVQWKLKNHIDSPLTFRSLEITGLNPEAWVPVFTGLGLVGRYDHMNFWIPELNRAMATQLKKINCEHLELAVMRENKSDLNWALQARADQVTIDFNLAYLPHLDLSQFEVPRQPVFRISSGDDSTGTVKLKNVAIRIEALAKLQKQMPDYTFQFKTVRFLGMHDVKVKEGYQVGDLTFIRD